MGRKLSLINRIWGFPGKYSEREEEKYIQESK